MCGDALQQRQQSLYPHRYLEGGAKSTSWKVSCYKTCMLKSRPEGFPSEVEMVKAWQVLSHADMMPKAAHTSGLTVPLGKAG